MQKRISFFILILMLVAFTATATIWAFKEMTREKPREITLVSAAEIYVPNGIKKEEFGLFFYDENLKKQQNENATFDKNKPVMIFFGSINDIEENYNIEQWQQSGYNVGCFLWKQLADDDPYSAEKKIWGSQALHYKKSNFETAKSANEYKDTPRYSMAETFVAFYYDFMNKQQFAGGEIRFQGLGLGANLMIAATSYLMELEGEGFVDKSFFPDRVTMFEAFFSNVNNDTYVNWLEKTVGNDGTIDLAIKTVKRLKANGVAIEYIRSSLMAELYATNGSGNKENFDKMLQEVMLLDYRSDWLIDGDAETMNTKYAIGQKWYNRMLEYQLPIDTALTVNLQYSLSPKTPTSYVYARMGTRYEMHPNLSFDADGIYLSRNANVPLVAGFAFLDHNENGNNDGRIIRRVDGLRVELYLIEHSGSRLIGSTLTKNGGYYQLPIEPIYITNTDGKEFYISIKQHGSYKISESYGDNQKWYMMTNNINHEKKSDSFFIYKRAEQKIINIGLTTS